ncbi:MAG: hypothetical protein ACK5MI_07840 [Mangrovibacterium sp.]
MKRILLLFLVVTSAFFSSCSLLEFSMATDIEPLTKEELSKRFTTRTFSSDFIAQVSLLADSIVNNTPSVDYKKNAIQWKLSVANTISPIAFQSRGDLALLETWVFCTKMNDFMQTAKADSLFGKAYVYDVQACSEEGEQQVDKMAKRLFSEKDYDAAAQFVANYSEQHPFKSLDFTSVSLTEQYREYMQIPDSLMTVSLGTMPEVIGDLTERMGMYGKQMQRNVDWKSDMVGISWKADSMAQQIMQRTDTLTSLLYTLSDIARNSPELAGQIAANMNAQLQPIINDMSDLMYNSVNQFDQQRDSIQQFVDRQRIALQENIVESGDSLMHSAADSLAQFVRKVSIAIVLVVILLALILFGLPFFLGYYIAKLRYRPKKIKNIEENSEIKKHNKENNT